jgi:hypothetical protein
MLRICVAGAALAAASIVGLPTAHADIEWDNAPSLCRALDAAGYLDLPQVNVTRGECVNVAKYLLFDQEQGRNSAIAGVCGSTYFQNVTQTTNKGQCINVLRNVV